MFNKILLPSMMWFDFILIWTTKKNVNPAFLRWFRCLWLPFFSSNRIWQHSNKMSGKYGKNHCDSVRTDLVNQQGACYGGRKNVIAYFVRFHKHQSSKCEAKNVNPHRKGAWTLLRHVHDSVCLSFYFSSMIFVVVVCFRFFFLFSVLNAILFLNFDFDVISIRYYHILLTVCLKLFFVFSLYFRSH